MLVTCWTQCVFKEWTEHLNLRPEWCVGRLLKRFSHVLAVKHFKITAAAATLLIRIFGFLIRSWTGLQWVGNPLTGLQVSKREHFCEHSCVRTCSSLQNAWFLCCVNVNLIFSKVENTNLYLIAGEERALWKPDNNAVEAEFLTFVPTWMMCPTSCRPRGHSIP